MKICKNEYVTIQIPFEERKEICFEYCNTFANGWYAI